MHPPSCAYLRAPITGTADERSEIHRLFLGPDDDGEYLVDLCQIESERWCRAEWICVLAVNGGADGCGRLSVGIAGEVYRRRTAQRCVVVIERICHEVSILIDEKASAG